MRRALTLSILALSGLGAAAEELTLAVDVPTDLQATTYLANQAVQRSNGNYSLRFDGPAAGLGPDVTIDALVVYEDGGLLFSTDAAFDVAGGSFGPADIVRWDGGGYQLFLPATAMGLSPAANIDALARATDGALIVSFAAAESIGGTTYAPSDLARVDGGDLSLLQSGAGMGLGADADVVGVERYEDGRLFLMFDEPTTAGGQTFLPGQIAEWDGVGLSLHFDDPGFPAASRGNDFSFPASPGAVEGLTVDKAGADLQLDWGASCSVESTDFAVYEGTLGNFQSHVPVDCATGGPSALIQPSAGDRYYLVVPVNAVFEGSYGLGENDTERSPASGSCLPERRLASCP